MSNGTRSMKSRTYTVNQPTRTFTWPQPKAPWWRRLLRLVTGR